MTRSSDVARVIHDICVNEYGLAPEDLIFDALTFTLATGDEEWIDSAVETIEGIRLIKRELPGVLTSLGVSNVSFGLSPRARSVLNSIFLHHCVAAGLDMAMVNPTHTIPYMDIDEMERGLADDLVLNRRPDALQRLISHFDSMPMEEETGASKIDKYADVEVDERIHQKILHRVKDGIEDDIEEALDKRGARKNDEAVDLLNNVLLPAMKDVGDRFGRGELILPFVLQSAEVMKKAVAKLENFLDRIEGQSKGKIVLATVYGDVHDIGKSLVNTILSNNGYTTFDLGRQVPIQVILDKAMEVGADAIGLSALLVSTSKQMPLCLHELDARGLDFPVLIGGAAINRSFGRRIWHLEDGRPYAGGVFYCSDAFEGLDTIELLRTPEGKDGLRTERQQEADKYLAEVVPGACRAARRRAGPARRPAAGARAVGAVPRRPRGGRRPDRGRLGRHGSEDPLQVELGRQERARRGVRRAGAHRLRAAPPAHAAGGRRAGLAASPRRVRLLPLRGRRRGAGDLRRGRRVRARAAPVPPPGAARPACDRRLLPHDRRRRARHRRVPGRHGRSRGAGSRRRAVRRRGVLGAVLRARHRDRRDGGHGRGAAPAGQARDGHRRPTRAGATRGAIRRARTSSTTCWCATCSAPPEAIGIGLTSAFQLDPEQSTAAIVVHHPSAVYFGAALRALRPLAQRARSTSARHVGANRSARSGHPRRRAPERSRMSDFLPGRQSDTGRRAWRAIGPIGDRHRRPRERPAEAPSGRVSEGRRVYSTRHSACNGDHTESPVRRDRADADT